MELDIAQLCDKIILIILVWLQLFFQLTFTSEDIYFDKFGHCQRKQPFDLASEKYILRHVGGGFAHETLICDVTFKAPSGFGVCLTFSELEINDCSVRLQIYASATSSGPTWRVLGCTDSRPAQMCSINSHVTVRVIKDKLNYNRGYAFEIHVQKSKSITEKGVLFVSLGVFVAIILGVVFFTGAVAFFFLYCCCCKRRNSPKMKTEETSDAAPVEHINLVQPSAPPVDVEDPLWAATSGGHLYSHSCYSPYSLQHPPPPYVPPPPYQLDSSKQAPSPKSNPELKYPTFREL